MNFFEHQAQARGQTRRLVFLFGLAVLCIASAILGVVLLMLQANAPQQALLLGTAQQHLPLLMGTLLAVLAVIALAALYKTSSLRAGGGAVARGLGATLITPDTREPRYRRLRNVVEEIAIASGVPVPEIYVLEQEEGINAFAAGWSPADAAVCVTRGTLEKLNRDELQGVIAHEFSHVLNGDMRLNIRLMGILFGILVLAVIGREIFSITTRARGGSRKDGGAVVAVMLAALGVMAVGYIGLFFGRLIKAGVSRQREFLADASAVQFTRQTAGIAGALKKIGGLSKGSRLQSGQGEEVSHMLFGDGVGYSALFATHPPLLARIQKLEPGFKQAEIDRAAAQWNEPGYVADDPSSDAPVTSGLTASPGRVTPQQVVDQIAHPSGDDYQYAEAVHAAIPPGLRGAAEDESQAWPLNFALVLDRNTEIRVIQLAMIETRCGRAMREASASLHGQLSGLHPAQRLPLAALSFTNLKRHPRAELLNFLALMHQLIRADGQMGLFEFCLGTLLRMQITDALNPSGTRILGSRKLGDCQPQTLGLLGVVAAKGHQELNAARQAYQAGAQHLFARAALRYEPPADAIAVLDSALPILDQLNAAGKQLLIEALVLTLNHDRRVTVAEGELLRAICAGLHCPLPPLLHA